MAELDDLVDVIIEDDRWSNLDIPALAQKAAVAVLGHHGLGAEGYQIALLACDDARISLLNNDFRAKANPTNVLSWPSETRTPDKLPSPGSSGDPTELGDVAIAFDTCMKEAVDQHKSPDDHVTHLIIHAILHLFGYDHEEDDDATLMEAAEVAILSRLGISDPYADRPSS